MEATEQITLLGLLKCDEIKPATVRNAIMRCTGCDSHVFAVVSAREAVDMLCFTCRQLAHAAANPCRWGIVEGSA